ncbi:MAG TPA: PH domain-containing protein [Stellaceae bacterium]|nr:PH domain-containing protein [Stellaceae bacterium]
MKYVTKVLQPGETVVYTTHLHWLIFLPAILLLAVCVAFLIGSAFLGGDWAKALQAAAALFALLAIASWARNAVRRATTELAVTDRRVIYKAGLLRRHTLEMNRSKVESVDVDQTLMGRLLGFGTIIVRGTGGSLEPIVGIADPLTFRSQITAA